MKHLYIYLHIIIIILVLGDSLCGLMKLIWSVTRHSAVSVTTMMFKLKLFTKRERKDKLWDFLSRRWVHSAQNINFYVCPNFILIEFRHFCIPSLLGIRMQSWIYSISICWICILIYICRTFIPFMYIWYWKNHRPCQYCYFTTLN